MTHNPLVVARIDQPVDPWAGVWIAEDIEQIAQGIRNGSWVDGTLGAISATLDGLALLSDPIGSLLQYGISWLIEHVKPLSEVLDWLAGDPGQIAGNAQTWRNVAASVEEQAAELGKAVRWDVSEWGGTAGAAYRDWASQQEAAINGLAKAAETMAAITEAAGFLISTVRIMVRDAIATCVSRLAVYAGELLVTAGVATALVIEQVASTVAAWAAKIARLLRGLFNSLRALMPSIRRLDELIAELKKILNRLRRGPRKADSRTQPSGKPNPDNQPRGQRTDAHPTRKKDQPLRRENESADTLAQNGFDVEQNPPPKPNGKNPDYRIEGEYFDCYAPSTDNLDQIRKGISRKVGEGQADRIVLNLDDCKRSTTEIAEILQRKPIDGLEEIIVVKDGQVIPFYPFE